MTVTTTEMVTVDGLVLNTLAYNISTRAGRYTTPDVRTKNVELPGRHGTLNVPGKKFQQGVFTWSMWIRGANQDGSVPTDAIQSRLFRENLDLLMQVFTRRTGLMNIQQVMPDGSVRQCFGEVLAIVDPTSKSVQPTATFTVAITIPSCFWQDVDAITYTSSAGLVASQTLTLQPFLGATAPMEDLVWTITGAATNAKIQALESAAPLVVDTWMQYTGTVPTTKQLVVDTSQWSVAGSSGFAPSTANLVHSGSASFMSLQPGLLNTAPQVLFSATSVDSHTQLSVTGRRKYVVG